MRDQDESIPNVFTTEFLKRLSELPASRSVTAYEADHAGPWSVVKRADGFAIVKEGQSDPAALFQRFETAHLIAAILPGVARVRLYYTRSSKTHSEGVDVVTQEGGDFVAIGWLRYLEDEILEALHVVEYLLRSPASLAYFLHAATYEALEPAGGLVAQRLLKYKTSIPIYIWYE